jgi:hypothetical protein
MLASGGIDGTGIISSGAVSAFGSIVVNGTKFDTSNAAIIIRGEEIGVGDDVVLDNLDIGRVVTVVGKVSADKSSAVADRVTYSDNVKGPVEDVGDIDPNDPNIKVIVVLGQTVVLNALTNFKGDVTFGTIAQNDVVEVSGFFDDTGAIWATFLEKTGKFTSGLVVEVTGIVANLDTDLEIFEINDLMVNYSSIAGSLPEGIPADGLLVEVEGTLDATGGEILATEIELEAELGDGNSDVLEVTGFITKVVSDFEFTVGNQVVKADIDTLLVDGTPADIGPGVKLEVEGSLVDGILFADEIEFWDPDQVEVEGIVRDFVSVFEFTVGDQVVNTTADTIFEPEDLIIEEGMKLEVKGVPIDIDHTILVADKVCLEKN